MLQMVGHYGGGGGVYVCYSVKCKFSGPALYDRKVYRINDKIYTSPEGIRYRWMFLAKSHVQQPDTRYSSYRCLPCLLSKDDSAIYHDQPSLFDHLADHQGTTSGNTVFDGRLKFTNNGAEPCYDNDYDLEFPEPVPAPPEEPMDKEIAVVVSATVPLERSKHEEARPPPSRDLYAYDEQPDDNPWA